MSTQNIYNVIGIMSGTSMDGIDCSYIRTDGKNHVLIKIEKSYNYSNIYRNKLKKIISLYKLNKNINLLKYETLITKKFIEVINNFIKNNKINKSEINFIGLSGQTIFHDPKNKKTIQLGSCKEINKKLNIKVIGNFRDNDINNGGQGAPIGAFYHKYILDKFSKNSAIINIGGISNISFIKKNKLTSFDIGPGNSLIDDLVFYFFKKNFDINGSIAFKGKINNKIIKEFKKDIYFKLNYPKSLDREYFKKYYNLLIKLKNNDSIATASMLTIEAINLGIKLSNKKIKEIFLTGGGRKNIFIFKNLKKLLINKNIKVINIDKLNLNGDMLESQAFAYIAVRSYLKLPISIPTTTGVKKPLSGGKLYK